MTMRDMTDEIFRTWVEVDAITQAIEAEGKAVATAAAIDDRLRPLQYTLERACMHMMRARTYIAEAREELIGYMENQDEQPND